MFGRAVSSVWDTIKEAKLITSILKNGSGGETEYIGAAIVVFAAW